MILGVLVALGVVGWVMWRVERDAKEPSGDKKELSKALFWAFEPVIGYKASQHKSRTGRVLGTLWGLFGLVFVTGLTANVSSRLTVDQLAETMKGPGLSQSNPRATRRGESSGPVPDERGRESPLWIDGPDDLGSRTVGTVANSTALKFCEKRGVRFTAYPEVDLAMQALAKGEVEAVVYESPVLAYAVATKYPTLRVLAGTFSNHGYAFRLRPDSPLRKDFNRALLAISTSDEFSSMVARYLGRAE